MHKYIVLFTLLTFYCVTVSAGLQEVLNIAKCIADIHQELPNSCVYIMNSEGEERGENFFPPQECCVLEKCAQIVRHQQVYLEIHFWKY